MSFSRLPFITLCLVLGVGLMTGACAAPLAVSGASYAADGGLLVASDKTSTDHMISMVSKQDCACSGHQANAQDQAQRNEGEPGKAHNLLYIIKITH